MRAKATARWQWRNKEYCAANNVNNADNNELFVNALSFEAR